MNPLEKISITLDEIQIKRNLIDVEISNLIYWCNQNRKEIRKLFPEKNKIYQITDIKSAYNFTRYDYLVEKLKDGLDGIYYFKPTVTGFYPERDIEYRSLPTVKGQLLDANFKIIEAYGFEKIEIIYLKDIDKTINPNNKHTKVYIMIDKNTSLYKIGRSKNPSIREKTLQSEKPTIELLYQWDAKISDEGKLHDMFENKRIRGEWFNLDYNDLLTIKSFFYEN
jgi:hypothetical protein